MEKTQRVDKTLLHSCHPKNSELEKQFHQCRRSAVLRGDTVKDDTGNSAVFTEQGASAPHMTAATKSWILFQDYIDVLEKQVMP